MPHPATPALATAAQAPVALTSVHPTDDGWLGRLQQRNADVTLPHVIAKLGDTSLANLRRAASGEPGDFIGTPGADADVWKTVEAAAWERARTGSTDFDAFIDEAVDLAGKLQQADGYLNSWGMRAGYEHFSDPAMGHELFVGSHLVKCAIALARTGDDRLMPLARRWADLVVDRFGPEGDGYDGHPGIESSLVELYRETGERGYLDTAKAILDRRGQDRLRYGVLPSTFFQDHEGVRDAVEALGHARRQQYLDTGCADVLAETDDQSLRAPLVKRWESAHLTKQYITGGLGSRHYDESFGAPYELPASRAYCETCASVADISVNHRLLLLTGEARYADAIEKIVHNILAGAVGAKGDTFFSSNPLQVRGKQRDEQNNRIARAEWVNHTCCPTALVRAFSSMGAYVATTTGSTLVVQQWVDATIDLPAEVGEGRLVIETDYPAHGSIHLRLEGTVKPGAKVRLRVPGWAETHTINGRSALVMDGYMEQPLVDGFESTLDFAMEPRFVYAHPRVDAVRGCRALLRGPVVYCAEGVDVEDLESLVFMPKAEVVERDGQLPELRVLANFRRQPQALYSRSMVAVDPELRWASLRPYAEWGNREAKPMRVWLPMV